MSGMKKQRFEKDTESLLWPIKHEYVVLKFLLCLINEIKPDQVLGSHKPINK